MMQQEFDALVDKIQRQQCEQQTIEVKSAAGGCPERLYDTYSSFSNQDEGGILVFGLDEKQGFQKVGVYDAQDLQKKLMEAGEEMTPVVRPVISIFDENGLVFVTAEIPPVDLSSRPCYKTARGRIRGSFIRVGDGDKPMTEYEVYSYEAFRQRIRNDIRPVEDASVSSLDAAKVEQFLLRRKLERPNLAAIPVEQLYELSGITKAGQVTLTAVLLFCPYPQAYYPQLNIIAARVPGTELGQLDGLGRRFEDSKRLEGPIPEMLEAAMAFVRSNMRISVSVDRETGKRSDVPEYPMDAVREVVLNALIHRDYSVHTEDRPIQLTMYADRLEITNPGGLYGRLTLEQLGKVQPDTRNPVLVTTMESIGQTENRYSGVPRIRRAMEEAGLPEPKFEDLRGDFRVTLYNTREEIQKEKPTASECDERGLLAFCAVPRSRQEIADHLGIASVQYAVRRYVEPLIDSGELVMTIPEKPKSPKQRFAAKE